MWAPSLADFVRTPCRGSHHRTQLAFVVTGGAARSAGRGEGGGGVGGMEEVTGASGGGGIAGIVPLVAVVPAGRLKGGEVEAKNEAQKRGKQKARDFCWKKSRQIEA